MEIFREGKVSFAAENRQTRDAGVFFNPSREFDRDLNVLFVDSLGRKDLSGVDVFGASGVRGLRLCVETKAFSDFTINDIKTYRAVAKNIKSNKKALCCEVSCTSFNAVDIGSQGRKYDYIDIDPFGSPVRYMVEAVPSLNTGGILAITATDTAALYGKAKRACALKYGAVSYKTPYFRELGLRIMIKRAEEIANLFFRSVEPVLFDVRKHYARVYLRLMRAGTSGKIGFVYQCPECPYRSLEDSGKCAHCGSAMMALGPLWLGSTFDRKLVDKMYESAGEKLKGYLGVLRDEKDTVSFYTTSELASYTKTEEKPIEVFGNRTVLDSKGFRSDEPLEKILETASS